MSGKVYDKTGREICVGDVVKVFHFIGARSKRHYMYKQAVAVRSLPESGLPVVDFSHLNLSAETYHEWANDNILPHYEIIQSVDANFEDRPRRTALSSPSPLPETRGGKT